MMTEKELIDKSNYVIDFLSGMLSDSDLKEFIHLCEHDECQIAYEFLCTQIYEFDIHISEKVFNILKEISVFYGIKPIYWKSLEKLVVKIN